MDQLKVIAYKADFETRTNDDQRILLKALLKTEVGKEITNEIEYEYKLEYMFRKFTICKVYPNVLHLLKSSDKAQRHFVDMDTPSAYPDINVTLNSWFDSESRPEIPFKVYRSNIDKSLICMQAPTMRDTDTITIDNFELKLDNDFDFTTHIHSSNFDSDKIYIPQNYFYLARLEFVVWWQLYKADDF